MKKIVAAHTNIALVKYWGKKNIELNLPAVGSISVTLKELFTRTCVEFLENLKVDIFILNGKRAARDQEKRVSKFLDFFRKEAGISTFSKIVSENNFPTNAGLASSASGFAALAVAANQVLNLQYSPAKLPELAEGGQAQQNAYAAVPPGNVVNILRILTVGIGKEGMAGGQVLDLEFSGNKEAILKIHRMKTAELIKATMLSAAEIIGLSAEEKEILAEAGITIGVGFQMADDLLDIIGDEKEVGKKLKKDLGNKSPNCILFYGKEFIQKEIDAAYTKTSNLLKRLKIDFPPFLYLVEKMVYRSK